MNDNLNYSIEFINDSLGKLNPTLVQVLKIKFSLFNKYVSAKLILNDIGESIFNQIKIGKQLNLNLRDSETQEIYTFKLSIINFNKIPSLNGNQYVEQIDIDLVSSWYFVNTVKTKAYNKNVVDIICDMFSTDFKDYQNIFEYTSGDSKSEISTRYQINESDQKFIDKILKFGTIQNSPIYLYSDTDGKIKLHGFNEFSNLSTYNFYPMLNSNVQDGKTVTLKDDRLNNIPLKAYSIGGNVSDSASNINYICQSIPFSYMSNIVVESSINSTETNNVQSTNVNRTEYVYSDILDTPNDSNSKFIKYSTEKALNTFMLNGTIEGFKLKALSIGNKFKLSLPYEEVTNNATNKKVVAGDGAYIVTTSEFTYQGGMLHNSTFVAVQTNYN